MATAFDVALFFVLCCPNGRVGGMSRSLPQSDVGILNNSYVSKVPNVLMPYDGIQLACSASSTPESRKISRHSHYENSNDDAYMYM